MMTNRLFSAKQPVCTFYSQTLSRRHMQHPLTLLYTPLPHGSANELTVWRHAFEAALEPWLDARQREHVSRFGRATGQVSPAGTTLLPGAEAEVAGAARERAQAVEQKVVEAALSRLLARALLVTAAAAHHRGTPLPQITMDTRGRPLLAGWRAAFSHSGRAAFCVLFPAGQTSSPTPGLDAEALTSAPPDASAFAERECSAPPVLQQEYQSREALRRWTIKEAMLKAAGLGLGMPPAHIPTGRFGQRAGLWRGPLGLLGWRTVACPGHWLCVAQAGHSPAPRLHLLRQSPHTLLRCLVDLQSRPDHTDRRTAT